MDLIPSFSVDHTRIVPGIFISRQDTVNDAVITTYDIRLTRPNREPAIDVAAMHSLEHIIATFLRNDPDWKDEIIYWGPMGCLTGFYLILKGNRAPHEIYGLLLSAFQSVRNVQEVPGATAENCGNYLMHNLPMAIICRWLNGMRLVLRIILLLMPESLKFLRIRKRNVWLPMTDSIFMTHNGERIHPAILLFHTG